MKSFKISDDERQSILRLHETSTKKSYLNVITEQAERWDRTTIMNKIKEIQTTLKGKGYTISKNGEPDGFFGPMTFSAITSALSGSAPSSPTSSSSTPEASVNVVDELIKDPNVKAIGEKLKTANIDLTKMKPEEILPKVQELAADILKTNPSLINNVKSEIEKLMKITLPALTSTETPQGGNTETGKDDGAMDAQGLSFGK